MSLSDLMEKFFLFSKGKQMEFIPNFFNYQEFSDFYHTNQASIVIFTVGLVVLCSVYFTYPPTNNNVKPVCHNKRGDPLDEQPVNCNSHLFFSTALFILIVLVFYNLFSNGTLKIDQQQFSSSELPNYSQ